MTVPHQPRRFRRALIAAVSVSALTAATLMGIGSSSADLRQDVEDARAYLESLEMKAAAAHGLVEEAEYAVAQVQGKIDKTKTKVAKAKAQLEETQDTIGRYAATAYRSGGVDSSLQLLLVEDAQQFLDQAVVLDIVASGQSAALRKTQAARLQLAQAAAELAQQEEAEQWALNDLENRSAEFDEAVSNAESYLNGLEQELREQIEAERLRREAEARAAAAAAAAALNTGGGGSSSGGSSTGTTSANGGPNDDGAYNNNGGSGGAYSGGSGVSSDRAAIVVSYALAQVGKPYSFAAQPPSSWDCTKLTAAAWAQVGVRLTPYSYVQAQEVRRISPDELQPGDLLFFFKNGAHHASMYIGGGMIVEASSPSTGVRVTDVWNSWNVAHFSWAGRPYG
ncbi:MAG: NlpC/P60 family protein [Actinobacteria bacterium]|nr:NlpC/P60 family protein [Actinomycetota bacterium]